VRVALATSRAWPQLDPDSVPLLDALKRRRVEAEPVVWSDAAIDWSAFDAVVIRSTWDYVSRFEEFLGWVASVRVPLVNPAPIVAWNAHKSYLRDLQERGVPTVDTLWVDSGETTTVPWEHAVVKPAVDGSAKGLRRAAGGDVVVADADLMIQPLLGSIATEGELSLLYAGTEFSHAVRKRPRAGDIRVQEEWGGTSVPEAVGDDAQAVARHALDAVGGDVAYARVDLVRAEDGTLRLIELELIEPSLFLTLVDEGAADRFAAAVLSAAFGPSP
jgi:hypothetical protein